MAPTPSDPVSRTVSFRVSSDVARRVAEAMRSLDATSDSALYRRVIDEWLRMQEHPGVRFGDGPAGRRAALVGGPDVWEVILLARAFDFHADRLAAAYPWLTPRMLEVARRYATAYPDEIETWITRTERAGEDLARELDALGA